MEFQCLPAEWHNHPHKIVPAVRAKINASRGRYEKIFIGYGDCGTGGGLDALLNEPGNENIARLPGAHCYAFFAGEKNFNAIAAQELGTFYLTDYLARHFNRLIIAGLGMDQHPQLRADYFGNYKKLVYLAQLDDAELDARARAAAEYLELEYARVITGDGHLQQALQSRINPLTFDVKL